MISQECKLFSINKFNLCPIVYHKLEYYIIYIFGWICIIGIYYTRSSSIVPGLTLV